MKLIVTIIVSIVVVTIAVALINTGYRLLDGGAAMAARVAGEFILMAYGYHHGQRSIIRRLKDRQE